VRVHKLGEGDPEYVIVGGIHGDEPCGPKAIERFLDSDYEVLEPLKFIVANERALEQEERYLEADLNRVFPGDKSSDKYEERLAAKIMDEIEGKKVLDIHSTMSHPDPFVNLSDINEVTVSLAKSTSVSNVVYFPEDSGTMYEKVDGILAESGLQRTEEAAENAYNLLINFLAANGIIEDSFELSEPSYFQFKETVEGSGYSFTAKNFQKVEKGEVFAQKEGKKLRAEEPFYPVLMSTEGYDDMVGFKAERIER